MRLLPAVRLGADVEKKDGRARGRAPTLSWEMRGRTPAALLNMLVEL